MSFLRFRRRGECSEVCGPARAVGEGELLVGLYWFSGNDGAVLSESAVGVRVRLVIYEARKAAVGVGGVNEHAARRNCVLRDGVVGVGVWWEPVVCIVLLSSAFDAAVPQDGSTLIVRDWMQSEEAGFVLACWDARGTDHEYVDAATDGVARV